MTYNAILEYVYEKNFDTESGLCRVAELFDVDDHEALERFLLANKPHYLEIGAVL